ncbi:MAG: PqqD family peptide modification chaperone [Akkermansia sp.]|nr:PqqD family peptide modification chaperone [Akkermansia sp.]
MKFSLHENTYLRHAESETLLWNKRTYASRILKDAQGFLKPIEQGESKEIEEIIAEVAQIYNLPPQELADDVLDFYTELAMATFLNCDCDMPLSTPVVPVQKDAPTVNAEVAGEQNRPFPVGTFYERHALPSSLHIDLTNACTERCIHCYIADYKPRFLPLELGQSVLREFREAGGLTVMFSGGECMLHPQFRDFIRYAKSLNLNFIVMSNLTRCDAEMVEFLAEVQPQFVNVSLYSMKAEEHDKITTIPGSWQKTMRAILALEAAGVPVRLASPIMQANRHALPELLEFAKAHRMHLIPDCDIFGQVDHDCSNQSCALSLEETECVWCEHPDLFYKDPASPERCAPEAKVCDIGKSSMNLNAEGIYYPCDGCHGIVLGNAQEQSFAEVWQGEKLQALRAMRNLDFGECAHCENRPWCKVCPTRNFNETADMFCHTPARCRAAQIRRKLFSNN